MSKANQIELLNSKITALKQLQKEQVTQIKIEANKVAESIKPVNILKSTLRSVTTEPEIKDGLLDGAIGIATGFFTRKMVVGSSTNILKKLLGDGLQLLISNFVTNKMPDVRNSLKKLNINNE